MPPSSRPRPSQATPSRARGTTRGPIATPALANSHATPPDYEPPSAPLNQKAQQALQDIFSKQAATRVQVLVSGTSDLLSAVASEINENGAHRRAEYLKQKAKRDGEDDQDALEKLKRTQEKVELLTARLEEQTRRGIDDETLLHGLPQIVSRISNQASGITQTQYSFPASTQRSRARPVMGDEDDEDSDGDGEQLPTHERPDSTTSDNQPPSPSSAPSALLTTALASHNSTWISQSLGDRYANHNTYIQFKRSVHDGLYPSGDAPPLPDRSTWFSSQSPSSSRRGTVVRHPRDSGEDEDFEIAAENVSTKCPITFLPFRDQVLSSTKCPHSFEGSAILDMIRRSGEFAPATQDSQSGARQRWAKCPVCNVRLTQEDLRNDPVLLRQARRVEERERRAAAEEDEDEDEDGEEEGFKEEVKKESVRKERARGIEVPGRTQSRTSEGAVVMNLDSSADEEEEEEGPEEDDISDEEMSG